MRWAAAILRLTSTVASLNPRQSETAFCLFALVAPPVFVMTGAVAPRNDGTDGRDPIDERNSASLEIHRQHFIRRQTRSR